MPPELGALVPQLFVDGSEVPAISRSVSSFVVHVTGRRARAELVIAGPLPDADSFRVDVPATTLSLMLTAQEECFGGDLTAVEVRMPPAAAPSTVLTAVGTARDDRSGEAIALNFGVEIESGSVRRTRRGSTAWCVASSPGLRRGSWVDLTTYDPAFDGPFQVVELWHRFDTTGGYRVEFIARPRQSR